MSKLANDVHRFQNHQHKDQNDKQEKQFGAVADQFVSQILE